MHQRTPTRFHLWQSAEKLPDKVIFDLASDTPQTLPGPEGLSLLQRNGRLLIRSPTGVMCQLEATQAHMLQRLNREVPSDAFYTAILNACAEQQQQDERKSVHWSRHLLARVVSVTNAKGIIGCRSVTYHPHFAW